MTATSAGRLLMVVMSGDDDGGWAAFDKNVTQRWLEEVPFADHNAILDPTCSDLTARTLELFGYINFDTKRRSVRSMSARSFSTCA